MFPDDVMALGNEKSRPYTAEMTMLLSNWGFI